MKPYFATPDKPDPINSTSLRVFLPVLLSLLFVTCSDPRPQYDTLADYPVYPYGDLGVTYHAESSTFKLWSPALVGNIFKLAT